MGYVPPRLGPPTRWERFYDIAMIVILAALCVLYPLFVALWAYSALVVHHR